MSKRSLLSILLLMLLIAAEVRAQTPTPTDAERDQNWPVFRGNSAGVVASAAIPDDWDGASGKNIRWKSPVPLAGKNSPIVWGDSVFLSGASKSEQKVLCYDAETGTIRWQVAVGKPNPEKAPKVMEDAGFAASTMVTDGRRVFAIFATGDLAALDFSGNIVWSKALGLPENQYGHATSLAIWNDRLIVQFDQALEAKAAKSEMLALDTASGNVLWKTARPVPNSWTSPIVITTPAGPQIITAGNPWVIAYEPLRGTELWRVKCLEGDVAPSPAYAGGLIYVAMENAVGNAIKTDGTGDVTKTHVAWSAEVDLPDIVSPVASEKFVFFATSFGMVTCYDAKTGKKLWDHDFEQQLHASPLIVGDAVLLTDRKGITRRFQHAAEYKLLSEPALGEPVSATPAIAKNRIYLRSESNLYCIGTR